MIKIFDILNGKVIIDAASLAIPPFKEFWESAQDKSIAEKEISYCVFMNKWDTPYKAFDKPERSSRIKEHVFKDVDYKFSKNYPIFEQEFIRFMRTPSSRLLDAAENGIEFLIEEYNNLQYKEGIDAGDVSKWMAQLGPAIKSYEQLKEQVRTEEKLGLKAKGKAEINYFEMPRK